MALPDYEKLGAFYLGRIYDGEHGRVLDQDLLYDARHLTTHAVCVGMTGSGKTGLCLALLEEAAIDGIPAIAIDPKGDIANLMLTFPGLAADDFRPWIDEAEAARKGLSPEAYARQVADAWREGLAAWGQDGERIARLRAAAEFAVYTPGSASGRPLSVLRSFDAPPPALRGDGDALRERVQSAVSGLLALLGVNADPIRSREFILLSNILEHAWTAGRDLDLAALIGEIQKPPFERVGVIELESFYPAGERFELAMTLNNLLASPGFAAWMQGEPLDVGRLLRTDRGRPRVAILSIAHLSEAERMFFVTLLLNEVVAWMRTQAGTSTLRALLYMDEVFGYFPPTANPPSKTPMLTLLKQARAYGLGCVLATQNPVDLDYKGLSNTGTWFLGRLQTERDKARVLDGLEGASASTGTSFDRARTEALLSGLASRVFLMNDVHEDGPVLFHTRWAMSYLRGPLTRAQLAAFGGGDAGVSEAAPIPEDASPAVRVAGKPSAGRPVVPPDVPQAYLSAARPRPEGATLLYRPALLSSAQLHFADARRGIDVWLPVTALAPLAEGRAPADPWSEATWSDRAPPALADEGAPDAGYAPLPSGAASPERYAGWRKRFASAVYRERTLPLFYCVSVKAWSDGEQDEGAFRARLCELAREQRDRGVADLRERYAEKLRRLQERLRRANEQIGVQEAQAAEQTQSTLISAGTALLGALLGRKALSVGSAGRLGTTLRRGSRIVKERADVERAQRDANAVREQLAQLETELAQEVAELEETPDPASFDVEERPLRARKGDLSVAPVTLVWTPWALGADGTATPLLES